MSSTHAKSEILQIKDLHFGHENPRLVEFGITKSKPELEILITLWDAMDVNELVLSMAASG